MIPLTAMTPEGKTNQNPFIAPNKWGRYESLACKC
jgi:hypothetical protein